MKFDKCFNSLALLAAIGLLFAPVLFPICPVELGKPPMRCFYVYRAELLFAGLAVIGAVALFRVKTREARKVLGIGILLLALIIFSLPFSGVIGICGHAASPCHITAIFSCGVSILLALSGAVIAWHEPAQAGEQEQTTE